MGSRFDQDPTAPYGSCLDCEVTFPDREAMSAHLSETFEASGKVKGHRGNPSNPTRAERIQREVQHEADNAIDTALTDFVDNVWRLNSREDIPIKELTEAVKHVFADAEWAEAWAEAIEGEEDDDEDDDTPRQEHQETSLFDMTEMSS